ncbi:MAG: hypothetical protein NTU59_01530, partial [Coprothermobacterota bacterium]|nr:hypothetical protein [Coprothermobacterota bacterium]
YPNRTETPRMPWRFLHFESPKVAMKSNSQLSNLLNGVVFLVTLGVSSHIGFYPIRTPLLWLSTQSYPVVASRDSESA